MGQPGMAGKHQNPATQGGGGWSGNFTSKIASPCSSSLANACARVVAGDASHDQNPFGLQIGQNDPVRCSRFWGVFSRALDLKMGVMGLGFYLACKTKFI